LHGFHTLLQVAGEEHLARHDDNAARHQRNKDYPEDALHRPGNRSL
jgi:hypothetical protein